MYEILTLQSSICLNGSERRALCPNGGGIKLKGSKACDANVVIIVNSKSSGVQATTFGTVTHIYRK